MVHVGIGYDVHAFALGRPLVLGGVTIPFPKGLDGHSDADALLHAITDALLGAIGEVDIGHLFPNNDPTWKDAASRIFLVEAARRIRERGGRIINIDATVLAENPKIYPHITAMKAHIADALGMSVNKVGLKATTNERMGFVGREEGIAAMAMASVDLPESSATD
jgi:2-C-methyl-D-erythritol 2,4-cyclodiphosphate synthase